MKYNEYKHALVKPDTHQKLKLYQYEHRLNSFDEAINKLLERDENE